MKERINFADLRDAFEKCGIKYVKLDVSRESFVIITEHWGKILGPFRGEKDAGTMWLSEKAGDSEKLNKMIKENDWCIGGDRVWLAPEFQYNIMDRAFLDSGGPYSLPAQIDPGNYSLAKKKDGAVKLRQDIEVKLYHIASGDKRLSVDRTIKPAEDPLRFIRKYEKFKSHLDYCGYTQEIVLKDLSPDDAMTEMWNLIQLYTPGTIVMPAAGVIEYQDYYEPIDERFLKIAEKTVFLRLTGDRKYKIGFQSASIHGRVGYYYKITGDIMRLVIRNFYNSPSSLYIDEPIGKPGTKGDSVHFYNDDGGLGGFGELEVHGLSVGGQRGRTTSRDLLDFWQYTGPQDVILAVSDMLLGVSEISF